MANSYTQIHIQFVFAVKYRAALIGNDWKERLHQYITGIFQKIRTRCFRSIACPIISIFLQECVRIGQLPHLYKM